MNVIYIKSDDLASLILQYGPVSDKYLICDVRTYDYTLGHLPNHFHLPATNFEDTEILDSLVRKVHNLDFIVFHCHLSQERGPYCCRLFTTRLRKLFPRSQLKIYVLEGGFKAWRRQFSEPIVYELLASLISLFAFDCDSSSQSSKKPTTAAILLSLLSQSLDPLFLPRLYLATGYLFFKSGPILLSHSISCLNYCFSLIPAQLNCPTFPLLSSILRCYSLTLPNALHHSQSFASSPQRKEDFALLFQVLLLSDSSPQSKAGDSAFNHAKINAISAISSFVCHSSKSNDWLLAHLPTLSFNNTFTSSIIIDCILNDGDFGVRKAALDCLVKIIFDCSRLFLSADGAEIKQSFIPRSSHVFLVLNGLLHVFRQLFNEISNYPVDFVGSFVDCFSVFVNNTDFSKHFSKYAHDFVCSVRSQLDQSIDSKIFPNYLNCLASIFEKCPDVCRIHCLTSQSSASQWNNAPMFDLLLAQKSWSSGHIALLTAITSHHQSTILGYWKSNLMEIVDHFFKKYSGKKEPMNSLLKFLQILGKKSSEVLHEDVIRCTLFEQAQSFWIFVINTALPGLVKSPAHVSMTCVFDLISLLPVKYSSFKDDFDQDVIKSISDTTLSYSKPPPYNIPRSLSASAIKALGVVVQLPLNYSDLLKFLEIIENLSGWMMCVSVPQSVLISCSITLGNIGFVFSDIAALFKSESHSMFLLSQSFHKIFEFSCDFLNSKSTSERARHGFIRTLAGLSVSVNNFVDEDNFHGFFEKVLKVLKPGLIYHSTAKFKWNIGFGLCQIFSSEYVHDCLQNGSNSKTFSLLLSEFVLSMCKVAVTNNNYKIRLSMLKALFTNTLILNRFQDEILSSLVLNIVMTQDVLNRSNSKEMNLISPLKNLIIDLIRDHSLFDCRSDYCRKVLTSLDSDFDFDQSKVPDDVIAKSNSLLVSS
ncbi:hypothetical protein GEMRC1_007311 [Eukaryota sp. GEM-RC1]